MVLVRAGAFYQVSDVLMALFGIDCNFWRVVVFNINNISSVESEFVCFLSVTENKMIEFPGNLFRHELPISCQQDYRTMHPNFIMEAQFIEFYDQLVRFVTFAVD